MKTRSIYLKIEPYNEKKWSKEMLKNQRDPWMNKLFLEDFININIQLNRTLGLGKIIYNRSDSYLTYLSNPISYSTNITK